MVYVHLIEKDIPASAVDVWYMIGTKFADQNTMKLWSTKYRKCLPITNESDIPKHFLPTHVTMHYKKHDIKQSTPSSILGRIVNNPFYSDSSSGGDGGDGTRGSGGLVEQIQRLSKGEGAVSSDIKQILTFYSPSRKELTYVCSYPLPIVDFYECTIIVTENQAKKETGVHNDEGTNSNSNANANYDIKKKKKIIKKKMSKTTATTRNSSQNVTRPTPPSPSSFCTVEMECEFYVVPGFCWLAQLLGLSSKIRTDPRGPAGDLLDIKTYFQTKYEENDTWNKLLR